MTGEASGVRTQGVARRRPALFIDRDGTLITDVGYPRDPARVEPLPGVFDALRALQASFALVIISNQSGLGRGIITQAEASAVHDRVVEVFGRAGIEFAGAYYCPHAPEAGCTCRKPAPGLLLDAARDLGLDLAGSVMLGDKASDVAAGLAAGCGHALRFGPDTDGADGARRAGDWAAVVAFLCSLVSFTTEQ
jgi:histidinol-phosphate phosphatase family protein